MAYIYKHIRNDTNEVFYIGIGSDEDGKYIRANKKRGRNSYWINIVNKVGYSIQIIEDDVSWEMACEREKKWIKHYGRKQLNEGTLINMTDGGEGTLGIFNTNNEYQRWRYRKKIRKQKVKQSIIDLRLAPIEYLLYKLMQDIGNRINWENILKNYEGSYTQKSRLKQKINSILNTIKKPNP